MTVALNSSRVSRQSIVDLVVALIAIPLLVVFGLMMEANMRGDWTNDADTRWHVLGLGLALLFMSLLVCGYVTHRLGLCIWAASQNDLQRNASSAQRANGTRFSTDSQLHLVVSSELPPSYESVVSFDMPPPYCSVLIFSEKTGVLGGTIPKVEQPKEAKEATTKQATG